MNMDAYEFAEQMAEAAAGEVPDISDMIPPDGGDDKVSFEVVLLSGTRFRVTVTDITHAEEEDEDP